MNTVKLIIAAAVALTCSLNAFGQKNEKDATKGKESKDAPAKDHEGMNLTEEQKKKIKDIRIKAQKDVLPVKNQLAEKKAHLRTLTTVDKPDMSEINKTIDEMAALKTQIEKKKIAAKMEVRGLLNDEQRLKFDLRDGKPGKHMKPMHNGHRRKPNGQQPTGEH